MRSLIAPTLAISASVQAEVHSSPSSSDSRHCKMVGAVGSPKNKAPRAEVSK
ncbi:hypothetical protein [Methylogaea oryzae]|uniref:hypothetical protein n=1 Tax=Methylogaea oryzae TaxID=1295382 RepID=UPI0020D05572|nr:hypothetical protein [Methylogaea oryzae]